MRKLIMLAGVAALVASMPAVADAQGRGRGHGARNHEMSRAPQAGVRSDARARVDARLRRDDRRGRRTDRNRNGIPDFRERIVDRNGDGIDDRRRNRHGGNACPPGLANRTPACVPPGQARRMFREGQRVPTNYGAFTSYDDIPAQYREQFDIPQGYNYIYRDDSVYVVDPRTRLVRSIIDLIRR